MTRRWQVAGVLLAVVFAAGCRTAAPGGVTVDNGRFAVEFVDPDDTALGCLFIRAGWIRSLRTGEPPGRKLFWEKSLFSYHPAFGFAREILPEFELNGNRQLKIGVGIIEPNPREGFLSRPIELFPWRCEWRTNDGKTTLRAEQDSGLREGYGYTLKVTVTVEADSPVIVYEETLANTGIRTIAGTVYAHPFFFAPENGEECRYLLPDRSDPQSVAGAVNRTIPAISPELRTVMAETPAGTAAIGSDRPLEKAEFWNSGKDCFAVEPYLAFRLAPGERTTWKWFLAITGPAVSRR